MPDMDPELVKQMMETMKAMQKKMEEKDQPKEEDEWKMAEEPFREEEVDFDTREDYEDLIKRPSDAVKAKTMKVLQTGTIIDKLFLNSKEKYINGIPTGIQLGLTGIAGSGKSVEAEELAVRVANSGVDTLLTTSEDIFISDTDRLDLQARMMAKAKVLGLDWNKIKEHLFVMDTIANVELREWSTFGDVYRYVAEKNKIQLAIFDSVTVLESYRGSLKYRVMELCRFNQVRGITGIYINQRTDESYDKYDMAGGIGIAHGLDATMIIDYGRTYYGDQITDLGGKRGEYKRFIRMMDNRLSGFIKEHIEVDIDNNGLLQPTANGTLILDKYKPK